MNKGKIALAVSGACLAALGAGSLYLASFAVNGKRQTLEEAYRWQADKYDVSWYEPLDKTDYTITSYDGYELHAQLCRCPAASKRYVILSHGYTDNRYGCLKYMKLYLDAGYNCVIYDLRGHGENAPTFCTYSVREARDLHAVIDDTRQRFGKAEAVKTGEDSGGGEKFVLGLHGESLGAATTVAVLQYHPDVDFAVADCGFAEISNVLKAGLKGMHLPGWLIYPCAVVSKLRYGYAFWEARPIDALRGNQVPILFLHGAEDRFIVPENSMDMRNATAGYSELYLLPGATHANSVLRQPALYAEHLRGFLEKTV